MSLSAAFPSAASSARSSRQRVMAKGAAGRGKRETQKTDTSDLTAVHGSCEPVLCSSNVRGSGNVFPAVDAYIVLHLGPQLG